MKFLAAIKQCVACILLKLECCICLNMLALSYCPCAGSNEQTGRWLLQFLAGWNLSLAAPNALRVSRPQCGCLPSTTLAVRPRCPAGVPSYLLPGGDTNHPLDKLPGILNHLKCKMSICPMHIVYVHVHRIHRIDKLVQCLT